MLFSSGVIVLNWDLPVPFVTSYLCSVKINTALKWKVLLRKLIVRCAWLQTQVFFQWRKCSVLNSTKINFTWWLHDMETSSVLLVLNEGNPLITRPIALKAFPYRHIIEKGIKTMSMEKGSTRMFGRNKHHEIQWNPSIMLYIIILLGAVITRSIIWYIIYIWYCKQCCSY